MGFGFRVLEVFRKLRGFREVRKPGFREVRATYRAPNPKPYP